MTLVEVLYNTANTVDWMKAFYIRQVAFFVDNPGAR